jgi:hypothetical protein
MNCSPALQEMLARLLARYRLDPSERQILLKLEGGDQLVIAEEEDGRRVRFGRYVAVGGRIPLKDTEVLFSVSEEGHWIPYELYRDATGPKVYGRVHAARHTLTIVDPSNQEALAAYCDIWAFRLRDQGRLQRAAKLDAIGLEPAGPFLWPEPTVEEPDEEQLEEWMLDDVCEATDGCLTEPDGVCPHGHPSWLLRLGLI